MEDFDCPFPNANKLLDRVADICPFPATAQRLMVLVNDDRAPIDAIAAAVLCDPALTTQVLRVSNSAAFRHPGVEPVRDLRQALVTIGLDELRVMAGAMALLATFATRDELSLDLHGMSAVCGSVARVIAPAGPGSSRTLPFLCGLLCEIGVLACLAVDGPGYVELRRRMGGGAGDPWSLEAASARDALEIKRYGVTTRTIGARFLRRHQLPPEIADVVEASPEQPGTAPLLHRATAFARIATPLVVHALGRKSDPAVLTKQIGDVAKFTSFLEIETADLVHRCLVAAADMDRTLRAARD
jgi:HD-like signal output (HDOD) protein